MENPCVVDIEMNDEVEVINAHVARYRSLNRLAKNAAKRLAQMEALNLVDKEEKDASVLKLKQPTFSATAMHEQANTVMLAQNMVTTHCQQESFAWLYEHNEDGWVIRRIGGMTVW